MTADWTKVAVADHFMIQTSRLLIRPLTTQDQQLYLDLYSSTAVMAFIGPPLQLEKAKNSFQIALRLNAKVPFKRLFLAICRDDQPIGLCAINQWNALLATVEVGLMLLPAWQGQGYGTEAKLALSQKVQQLFSGGQVWTQTNPNNKAAVQSNITAGYQADPIQSGIFWFKPD
ncbi:MAG: GNAT family N-acetyltransferase [Gammaproteobacteria bacterium]|nr:GNAT family N-acetyltransferase [Gammaproteobacteria bacterium]MBU2059131.1 GNAT family N-acetyltransferase [Gammaproteobacteria bacterium]MBU2173682.1 GNAT family N-acetyltransferase [Gammaproteobacteria bacterium]MBU2246838.1 GNAT family N-acetyltransferase [Gammaproteobacteria bacterium]MBU2345354.1 GNAT family N-acetyltransferase [Gammaproteobacteria bacterium]